MLKINNLNGFIELNICWHNVRYIEMDMLK